MLRLDFLQAREQHRLQRGGILGQLFADDLPHARERGGDAHRVARVRARHRAGTELIHHRFPPDHRGERQRAADALAAADHIRRHTVVLERPELPRAPEARLHFVEGQHDLMLIAPRAQPLYKFHRREVRPDALVRLHDHTGDILRLHPARGDGREEMLEARVRLPIAIWKWRGDDRGVLIHDPGFLPAHAARLLRAERAPVKAALPADDADLLVPADLDAMRAAELDRAFRRLRARREQEHFLQPLRREPGENFCKLRALLARETIIMQQSAVHLIEDRLPHLRRAVARIRHEHSARPVEPAVAVLVVNGDVLRAIPHDRRLAAHGLRLKFSQPLQHRKRVRMRDLRRDAAILGFDERDSPRNDAEFFAHDRCCVSAYRLLPRTPSCYSHCHGFRYFRARRKSRGPHGPLPTCTR